MSYNQHWVPGQWAAICDRCGFKYKAYQLKKEWTGLMVCDGCWEPRHPQDLIKIPKEDISVPWARPEQPDTFVATITYFDGTSSDDFCTHEQRSAAAGFASAGCMQAGVIL